MIDFTINKEEHIQFIIENFNFEKVHEIMNLLHWEWFASADGVPSIDELKQTAIKLLYEICNSDSDSFSTGGLNAIKHNDHLELEFIISSTASDILNTGLIYERKKKLKTRRKKINKINNFE